MPGTCHAILKAYSAHFQKTMSEVMYDFARSNLQKQSMVCKLTESIFDQCSVQGDLLIKDKRIDKGCWGWMCNSCQEKDRCKCGLYDGLWVPNPLARKYGRWDGSDELLKRVRVYDHRNNKVWDPAELKYLDVVETSQNNTSNNN